MASWEANVSDIVERLKDGQGIGVNLTLCRAAAAEIELLRGRLKSLIEQCAYVRDSAEYVKHKKHHAVTHTMWSAFCKQIQAAKGNNI